MAPLTTGLAQTIAQKTTLSLVQRQSVELLQATAAELTAQIASTVAANPLIERLDNPTPVEPAAPHALESERTVELAGVARSDREPSYLTWSKSPASGDEDDFDPYGRISADVTLSEHLLQQAGCLPLTETDRFLVEWIIGSLDEEGFFTDTLEECAQSCPVAVQPEAWSAALKLVQSFDPAGVAAGDAVESLVLQLERRMQSESNGEKERAQLAVRLLREARSFLAKRDFRGAAKVLCTSPQAVADAFALLGTLNPHPASGFSDMRQSLCIIPEVVVRKTEAGWKAELNPAAVPRLRFDHASFELLTSAKLKGEAKTVWSKQAAEAKHFVHAVEQRFSTIAAVAQTIVDLQPAFFESGPAALTPMGLKDVAARLELAESTVSRACAGKYMQTGAGTFEFKSFFSSSVTSDDGAGVSSAAVRRRICEIVAGENPVKPLSDAAIAEMLAAEGIRVARRTVAKYRELEHIAPKSLRKALGT